MKLSNGEILDRLSILLIKQMMAGIKRDDNKEQIIIDQLLDVLKEVSDHDAALVKLSVLNCMIFMDVDAIAAEENLSAAGIIGKRIQLLNRQRSDCKNEIDADSGYSDIKLT